MRVAAAGVCHSDVRHADGDLGHGLWPVSSPFGGFKQSGFGRDKSLYAMEKFTDRKAIWIQLK